MGLGVAGVPGCSMPVARELVLANRRLHNWPGPKPTQVLDGTWNSNRGRIKFSAERRTPARSVCTALISTSPSSRTVCTSGRRVGFGFFPELVGNWNGTRWDISRVSVLALARRCHRVLASVCSLQSMMTPPPNLALRPSKVIRSPHWIRGADLQFQLPSLGSCESASWGKTSSPG